MRLSFPHPLSILSGHVESTNYGVIGVLYVENAISDQNKAIHIRTGLLDEGKMKATIMINNREISCTEWKNYQGMCFLSIKSDAAGQSAAQVSHRLLSGMTRNMQSGKYQ